jgi:hypothetical protein
MHKNATKCNEIIGKWCKNKHGASKITDTFETYHSTTAASLGEGHQEKQHTHFQHYTSVSTSQFLHHIPRTEPVLANHHSNTSSKTMEAN